MSLRTVPGQAACWPGRRPTIEPHVELIDSWQFIDTNKRSGTYTDPTFVYRHAVSLAVRSRRPTRPINIHSDSQFQTNIQGSTRPQPQTIPSQIAINCLGILKAGCFHTAHSDNALQVSGSTVSCKDGRRISQNVESR